MRGLLSLEFQFKEQRPQKKKDSIDVKEFFAMAKTPEMRRQSQTKLEIQVYTRVSIL